jgi:UDPglucose 6-dehydrogenase
MKICVFGLWHLGAVTAACLADAEHTVIGLDPDETTVTNLNGGTPPLFEPGLAELTEQGIGEGRLSFTTDAQAAVTDADVVWVTFDTPVDENDRANVDYVTDHIEGVFPYLKEGAVVLVSSQLPVGTAANLVESYNDFNKNTANVSFAVSPENLRLGKAIEVFTNPDRVVVGVSDERSRGVIREMLAPITDRIEWMSVPSAEMTKHALNAFLAASVTFANEIAAICEQVGADAKEVERGLKTEQRIGPKAYLGPGAAFSGGTLARDIAFLGQLAERHDLKTALIQSVPVSNNDHKLWAVRRLGELLGDLQGKTVAILGLTYKPGTDTLRRSLSVEVAKQFVAAGMTVRAHDPAVKSLPDELAGVMTLYPTVDDALMGAGAVLLATQWPDYRELPAATFGERIVLDANGFLRETLGDSDRYYIVGRG